MARSLARPELLALIVIAVGLAAFSARARPASADIELTAGGGSLSLSNSREGSAIVSLAPMRPGDAVTGTVTIGNTGTMPGDLALSTSNLVNVPGPGGGALSATLDLLIEDVTNPGSPVTVYSGTIPAMAPVSLGSLAAGASRDYSFRILFPNIGVGDNAYQGSSTSVQFDWTATNPGDDTDPPETTITGAPGALSASRDASFSFTADESGSTFECSLDGGAFTPCSSPASYTGLVDGAHVFSIQATDGSANTDPTPAGHPWTIDATLPDAALTIPATTLHGSVSLSATATDAGSGVETVTFQYSATDANWTTIATDSAAPYAVTWATSAVPDGLYDLRVVATDKALNSRASATVADREVDNDAPADSTGSGDGDSDDDDGGGGRGGGSGAGGGGSSGSGAGGGGSSGGGGGGGGGGSVVPNTGFSPPTDNGGAATPEAEATGDGTVSPGSLDIAPLADQTEDGSNGRNVFGLGLLATAFALAGLAVWRRRFLVRAHAETFGDLVFWDQKLAHLATTGLRRLTGRS
jgi:hypothetical protein